MDSGGSAKIMLGEQMMFLGGVLFVLGIVSFLGSPASPNDYVQMWRIISVSTMASLGATFFMLGFFKRKNAVGKENK